MEGMFETIKIIVYSVVLIIIKLSVSLEKSIIWKVYVKNEKLNRVLNILVNGFIYIGCIIFAELIFYILIEKGFSTNLSLGITSAICVILPDLIRGYCKLASEFGDNPLQLLKVIKNFIRK